MSGLVVNSVTNDWLEGVKVELLTLDSIVVDSSFTSDPKYRDKFGQYYAFFTEKKRIDGFLRFTYEGYETKWMEIHQMLDKKRKILYNLPEVKLQRVKKEKEVQLSGATVRATRVKFYAHGDTLTFDADAFQTAEGSMLDALLKQLPGVELKDDGQILVNGRYVESLLLNGKDFFKNDRSVMLENLPAYMVKHVQTYEKAGERSHALGRDMHDKEFVMDVRLKRQYQIGWIANAEGGIGTKDRYMGRAFGLRFSPNSRLSFFTNLNNVNEARKPGQNGDWTPDNMPMGQQALKTGGLDYWAHGAKEKDYCEFQGYATLSHTDVDNRQHTATENFLAGGTTWTRAVNQSQNGRTEFSTAHRLLVGKRGRGAITLSPTFTYSNWHNNGANASATWNTDPTAWHRWADSLFATATPMLGRAVNHVQNRSHSYGHQLETGTKVELYTRIGGLPDAITLQGEYNIKDRDEHTFSHYSLTYPQSGAAGDYRNRYDRSHPNREQNYEAYAGYTYVGNMKFTVEPYYKLRGKTQHRNKAYYRLDRLAAGLPLGMLPSEREALLSALDTDNSYDNHNTELNHTAAVQFYYTSSQSDEKYVTLLVDLPVRFTRKHIDYRQALVDTAFSRHTTFFEPTITLQSRWHDGNRRFYLQYGLQSGSPALTNFIDVRSDSDPLNVTLGNARLRNIFTHSLATNYNRNMPKTGRLFSAGIDYQNSKNAFAYGSSYNAATGVRTYRPVNVSGNYNLNGDVSYTTPMDKAKRLTLSSATNARYQNHADYVGTGDALQSERSSVRTLTLGETLKLDYRLSDFKVGLKLAGTWVHAESGRTGFSTINAGNYQGGLTAQLELPAAWQFYTDLTLYSRRGYDDGSLNTDDLVWNARLAKRLLKGRLTLMLDGFDLLHELSSISYTLNGQARTETYRNVLPNYFMLHAVYRLNIKPKKRPGD